MAADCGSPGRSPGMRSRVRVPVFTGGRKVSMASQMVATMVKRGGKDENAEKARVNGIYGLYFFRGGIVG